MTVPRYDAVVIGAGANGLTAAAALGEAGLRVLLLERDETTGGQGRVVEFAPGFRAAPLGFDPGWLPPAVARTLRLSALEPAASDSPLSVAVEPGKFLTLSRDVARAADAIRAHSAGDAAKWPAFTARMKKLAGFLEVLYQTPAPNIDARSLGDLLPLLGVGRKFRALGRVDMIEFLRTLPMSVWELLDDWFESAPLKAAVAAGGIQDFQQGPRSGGTGFVLLHCLVGAPAGTMRGRVPWRSGPAAFTEAAEQAARRAGVTVRAGATVARVQVKDDAVAGVVLEGGEEIDSKYVLSTANPARTFLDWVDPVWLDPEFIHAVRNIRHRGCTAVALYALDALPRIPGLASPEALAGTVSLTPRVESLERAADAAKYGRVSEKPHVEVTVPTLHWPDLAPAGKHVLAARVQYAPYRLAGAAGWDAARRDALADSVTAAIEGVAPGFGSTVLHRAAWSPLDLEQRFGLREGAATHGELGLDQILFMRPVAGWGNHATPIAGLYLGGAGTHPGPGILGGPGLLAARRLLGHRRRRNEPS
jgi:phytoene dehydrogenase-like protein